MGITKFLKDLFGISAKKGYSFTDEHREKALETRQMNAKIRKMKHEIELARMKRYLLELKEDLAEYETEESGGSDDTALLKILTTLKSMGGSGNAAAAAPSAFALQPTEKAPDSIPIPNLVRELKGLGMGEQEIQNAIARLKK